MTKKRHRPLRENMNIFRSSLMITLGVTLIITYLFGVLSPLSASMIVGLYLFGSLIEMTIFRNARKANKTMVVIAYIMLVSAFIILILLLFV